MERGVGLLDVSLVIIMFEFFSINGLKEEELIIEIDKEVKLDCFFEDEN